MAVMTVRTRTGTPSRRLPLTNPNFASTRWAGSRKPTDRLSCHPLSLSPPPPPNSAVLGSPFWLPTLSLLCVCVCVPA